MNPTVSITPLLADSVPSISFDFLPLQWCWDSLAESVRSSTIPEQSGNQGTYRKTLKHKRLLRNEHGCMLMLAF